MVRFFFMICGLALVAALSSCTSVDMQTTRACDIAHIPVNTGYNHLGSTLGNPVTRNPGQSDGKWVVIADPDPATTEPRYATAINPSGSWLPPLPLSRWIGPYPAGTTAPSTAFAGDYDYLSCFCFCDGELGLSSLSNMQMRSDNNADIFLNDILIGTVGGTGNFGASQPFVFETISPDIYKKGINCLRVTVHNDNLGTGLPTGFNLVGLLTKLHCCEEKVKRPPSDAVDDPLLNPNTGRTE